MVSKAKDSAAISKPAQAKAPQAWIRQTPAKERSKSQVKGVVQTRKAERTRILLLPYRSPRRPHRGMATNLNKLVRAVAAMNCSQSSSSSRSR
jgi:hypothetical protein